MDYEIDSHTAERMVERNIPLTVIDETLQNPDAVTDQGGNRYMFQKAVRIRGRPMLLRVATLTIGDGEEAKVIVTTVYVTRVGRYGS